MTASSAAAVFVAAFSMLCGCRGIEPESRMVLPAPQNLELILYDETSLLLTWDPVEGAEHYNVYLVDASTGNAVMTSAGLTETQADAVEMYGTHQDVTPYQEAKVRSALLAENFSNYGGILNGQEIGTLTDNMMKHAKGLANAELDQFDVYADKFRAINEAQTALGEAPGSGRNFR